MDNTPPFLAELLNQLASGQLSVDHVLQRIGDHGQLFSPPTNADQQPIAGATVDLGRQSRCGFAEVIYGQGKSADLITQIVQTQLEAGQNALVTRIDAITTQQVRMAFANSHHNSVGHTLSVSNAPLAEFKPLAESECGSVLNAAVISAGSTDAPVAEEAIETLHWMGIPVQRFDDIGVAGPQRLLSVVPRLRQAAAVVVVAGMEGALPSAVAGHLSVPVFAVPTSVGYGANLAGITPLLGMLSSCAANVAVVNIDAGFKGGYLAGMVVHQLQRLKNQEAR